MDGCSSSTGQMKEHVRHREAGPGAGPGHRLLLLLGRSSLHHLEVVEGCGEVVHQALLLYLLLSLQQRE